MQIWSLTLCRIKRDRLKAALSYVDELIGSPSPITAEIRMHVFDTEVAELAFDMMRNAGNKAAVALGADAPQVDGVAQHSIGPNGQTVFT